MERPHNQLRIGLVLSGGGARGFAHIGVLKVLERNGAKFDVVAGTSMGAILGALYANGMRANDLQELVSSTGWTDVVDFSLKTGLMKGDRFKRFLADHLPPSFEDLQLPFAVTTTDVETGESVMISEGDLVTSVRASSSFPGAFEPIKYLGRTLADGGIVNNLPVAAATALGANRTVASDVSPARYSQFLTPEEEGTWWERTVASLKLQRRNPMAHMLLRSSDIMQAILVDIQASLQPADLRIRMPMASIGIEAFVEYQRIIDVGEEAAEKALNDCGGWSTLVTTGGHLELSQPVIV